MTKDRARKHAARQRAAVSGERYVVAQRAGADVEPRKNGRLHDLTHRVPGVPSHVDGGLQSGVPRTSNSNPGRRHQGRQDEPRVLVAWQNWIARRLRVGSG